MARATRGVIFDMDGVLIDWGAHHRAAWRALLDELGVAPARPDYWRLTIGRPETRRWSSSSGGNSRGPRRGGSPTGSATTTCASRATGCPPSAAREAQV